MPMGILYTFSAALLAMIEQKNYYVSEDSEAVEICVILEGEIEMEVIISIATLNDSAFGNQTYLCIIE